LHLFKTLIKFEYKGYSSSIHLLSLLLL